MRFVARAALAVLLLAGVYVLALGIVGGLALAVYEGVQHGFTGYVVGKGVLVLIALTVAMARALWAVRRTGHETPTGLLLTEADQPRLWAEVRELAATVGTRAPDEIRLVPEVNASVSEDSRFLGLVGGRRVLYVGVPLLLGLTRLQLRAVLAHELGHYSHRHTALAPIVYRGQVTLGHIVDKLGSRLTARVFAAYGRLYLRVTRSVTRRQELEADRWSHRIAGRAASAGAMRELPALDALWGFFLDEYALRVEGVRPDELFLGFAHLLSSPQRQREMEVARRDLPEDAPSPYDTHPSLASRVAFFEALPDDGITDDNASAIELVADEEAVLHRLEADMVAGTELEPRPWTWIAETAGATRARERAALLGRGAQESGAATLRDAIGALGRGDGGSLARPFVAAEAPPEQAAATARSLVIGAVSAGLVAHCGARFVLDWDSSDTLVDASGHRIDVAGLVEGTTDPESADTLLVALAAEGVPPSYAVDPAAMGLDGRQAEPGVHAVAACAQWLRTRVLVVSDHALIVKRLGMVESMSAARHGLHDTYGSALKHVAKIPLARLLEDRRATVYSWDRVGPVTVSGRRMRLSLDDQSAPVVLRPHAVAGDLYGSLAHHLGARLAVA